MSFFGLLGPFFQMLSASLSAMMHTKYYILSIDNIFSPLVIATSERFCSQNVTQQVDYFHFCRLPENRSGALSAYYQD